MDLYFSLIAYNDSLQPPPLGTTYRESISSLFFSKSHFIKIITTIMNKFHQCKKLMTLIFYRTSDRICSYWDTICIYHGNSLILLSIKARDYSIHHHKFIHKLDFPNRLGSSLCIEFLFEQKQMQA